MYPECITLYYSPPPHLLDGLRLAVLVKACGLEEAPKLRHLPRSCLPRFRGELDS